MKATIYYDKNTENLTIQAGPEPKDCYVIKDFGKTGFKGVTEAGITETEQKAIIKLLVNNVL